MSKASKKPPMGGLTYQSAETLSAYYGANEDRFFVEDIEAAHVITSRVAGQVPPRDSEGLVNPDVNENRMLHKLVIDIDMPAVLVPSSTPGHFHLYVDNVMTWGQYVALLRALAAANIVEPGYVKAAERRGFTAVRLPWIKKPKAATPRVDASEGVAEFNGTDF